MFSFKKLSLAAAAVVLASSAHSAPIVTFFQQNIDAVGVVSTQAAAARSSYLAEFTAVDTYGFEDRLNGEGAGSVGAISFNAGAAGTIKATLGGDGQVRNLNIGGRFNTTTGGTNYWQAKAGGVNSGNTAGSFSMTFDKGISAFSFYGTDIGDFEGSMQIILTPSSGAANVVLNLNNASPAVDRNLLFFGFLDREVTYSKITFLTLGSSTTSDFFGFDDFIIADRSQIRNTPDAPEPGSLALVGLALVAAGGVLRKRKAA